MFEKGAILEEAYQIEIKIICLYLSRFGFPLLHFSFLFIIKYFQFISHFIGIPKYQLNH
jgi:hypothetical protein